MWPAGRVAGQLGSQPPITHSVPKRPVAMSEVSVQPVLTGRQRKQFLQFPWKLYANDPHWVPPLRMDQPGLVGYKRHPFYEQNEVQTFLAFRGRELCGRIAAIWNRLHNQYHRENLGFWGFFECVDDQEVANALLDSVRQWFSERGIYRLRGPANPSINYTLGMLVEGFDSPPTFMMTYNPPYYPTLVEAYGFRKSQDLYAYWGHIDFLPQLSQRFSAFISRLKSHFGIQLRTLDRRRFRQDIEEFLTIYNQSLAGTWGFVPLSQNEVHHIARGLKYLLVPELAVAAEVDGRMVGAAFCLPDYNPEIRAIDGRLFPFGFFRLLRAKRQVRKIRILSANVVPEYQRLGIGLVMLAQLAPFCIQNGIREAELSWVLESNALSRGSLEKGGAKRIKTYRLYDLETNMD